MNSEPSLSVEERPAATAKVDKAYYESELGRLQIELRGNPAGAGAAKSSAASNQARVRQRRPHTAGSDDGDLGGVNAAL